MELEAECCDWSEPLKEVVEEGAEPPSVLVKQVEEVEEAGLRC